jgi:hypothetical protein
MLADIPPPLTHPPTLLAIIRAARLTGDAELELEARRLLREEHGIEIVFLGAPPSPKGGPPRAA